MLAQEFRHSAPTTLALLTEFMRKCRLSLKVARITKFQLMLVGIILAKVSLSAVTVSSDSANLASQLMAESIVIRSTPWGFVNWIMYEAWFRLPIDKSNLLSNLSNPGSLRTFALDSSSLIFFLKIPAILLDGAIGFALYQYAKHVASVAAGRKILMAWLLNPFSTLTIEMWGSFAILPTALFLLALLALVQLRTITSGALVTATFAIVPILSLAIPITWMSLAKSEKWKSLLFHFGCTLVGLAAYMYWTTSLGLDPYRIVRTAMPFTLAVTDLLAEPYVLFGASIGFGTSLTLGYLVYAYSRHISRTPNLIAGCYGTLAILMALSIWDLTFPLVIVPYLCLLTKDGLSRMLTKTAIFLMALLPTWTIFAATPQLFMAGTSFLFIPVPRGTSLLVQGLLENASTIFILRPFLRSVVSAALIVVSLGALYSWNESPSKPDTVRQMDSWRPNHSN